jgi:hypothetical protein
MEHVSIAAGKTQAAQHGYGGSTMRREHGLRNAERAQVTHLRDAFERGGTGVRNLPPMAHAGEIAVGKSCVVMCRSYDAVEVDFGHRALSLTAWTTARERDPTRAVELLD